MGVLGLAILAGELAGQPDDVIVSRDGRLTPFLGVKEGWRPNHFPVP